MQTMSGAKILVHDACTTPFIKQNLPIHTSIYSFSQRFSQWKGGGGGGKKFTKKIKKSTENCSKVKELPFLMSVKYTFPKLSLRKSI